MKIDQNTTKQHLKDIGAIFGLSLKELTNLIRQNYLDKLYSSTKTRVWDLTHSKLFYNFHPIQEFIEACYISDSKDFNNTKFRFSPEAAKCGECGGLNLQYDDVGFFYRYKNRSKKYKSFCEKCGKPQTSER